MKGLLPDEMRIRCFTLWAVPVGKPSFNATTSEGKTPYRPAYSLARSDLDGCEKFITSFGRCASA